MNVCQRPKCGNTALPGWKFCAACQKYGVTVLPYDRPSERRGKKKAEDAFYDTREWRDLRNEHRAHNIWCESCNLKVPRVLSEVKHVDHILPRLKWPSLELSPDNLQSLCLTCHNRKSRSEIFFRLFFDYRNKILYYIDTGVGIPKVPSDDWVAKKIEPEVA